MALGGLLLGREAEVVELLPHAEARTARAEPAASARQADI